MKRLDRSDIKKYIYLLLGIVIPLLYFLFVVLMQKKIAFSRQATIAYKETASLLWSLIPCLFYVVLFFSLFATNDLSKKEKKKRKLRLKKTPKNKKYKKLPFWFYLLFISLNFIILVLPTLFSIIPRWELTLTNIEKYNFLNRKTKNISLENIEYIKIGIQRKWSRKSSSYNYIFIWNFYYNNKLFHFSNFKNEISKVKIYEAMKKRNIRYEIVGEEYFNKYINERSFSDEEIFFYEELFNIKIKENVL